jgi:HK97 gp10 family phage protein
MAEPLMTITADVAGVLQALDRLGAEVAQRHVQAASRVTANKIDEEARRRVRRRTGKTAEGITVRDDFTGKGSVVVAERRPFSNLPGWLEHGTVHMRASPFLFNSARLEEGAHLQRIARALQDAIDEQGFGV